MFVNRNTKRLFSFFDIDFAVLVAAFAQFFEIVITLAFFRWFEAVVPFAFLLLTASAIWLHRYRAYRAALFYSNVVATLARLGVFITYAVKVSVNDVPTTICVAYCTPLPSSTDSEKVVC